MNRAPQRSHSAPQSVDGKGNDAVDDAEAKSLTYFRQGIYIYIIMSIYIL